MSARLKIRKATIKDLPRIRAIYNEAILERTATCDEKKRSLAERRRWFKQFNSRYPIFVLCVGEEVAGYGCLFRYSPKSGYRFAVENSLYIDGRFRGRGFGKKILRHLISAARTRGFRYIEARVFAHNPVSLKLHRKHGFKLIGVQERIANLDGKWFSNTILSLHI